MTIFNISDVPEGALQGMAYMAQVVEMLIPDGQRLRHPFWEFHWGQVGMEAVTCSLVLFFSGILCSAAGIGGGGIYVVVLMLFGGMTPHNAVPLSKAVVFIGAIASMLVNLKRMTGEERHTKPVIDVYACRVTIPAALMGTFLGVLMNWHADGVSIVLLLTVLLCFMSALVVRTALSQRAAELAGTEAAKLAEIDSERQALMGPGSSMQYSETPQHETPQATTIDEPMSCALTKSINEKTLGEATLSDVIVSFGLMGLVILCGILRFHMHACREEKEGITRPGSCDHPVVQVMGPQMDTWLSSKGSAFTLQVFVYSVPFVCCASLMLGYARSTQQLAGWSSSRIVKYQVVSVLTGALAGLVGVGGGLVFSPFFLLTGMEPAVAIGTSSTIVLFIASSTSIQYVFTDRVIMPLAFIYGIVTLVASYAGTKLVHVLQDHFSARRSYLTFIVALGVGLSAVLSFVKLGRMMEAAALGLEAGF
eukprot:CAMPEP_0170622090 /NCGR_PEP_ID=MMETSP0224-20130122/28942_1 /TAXON_ID=285029 /ORGANISM="Togula jolla, Strain CCCM 725" /LENGTH=478 /DNA_ID=CAMNT_0010948379 /DNA_START=140 /DNA_END=1576 /DNA_ORIENTATION=-